MSSTDDMEDLILELREAAQTSEDWKLLEKAADLLDGFKSDFIMYKQRVQDYKAFIDRAFEVYPNLDLDTELAE